MKQIKIGTCVPGAKAEEWLKGFIGKGFETFSLNFHMSLEGTDLDKLALSTEKLLAGTDSKITTVGYYCKLQKCSVSDFILWSYDYLFYTLIFPSFQKKSSRIFSIGKFDTVSFHWCLFIQ